MDETGNGAIQVQDAGSLGLHGSASNASIAAGGRFAGGRTSSAIGHTVNTANPVNTFGFGAGSFTMETWMKTGQLATNRSIFYLRNLAGYGGGFPASLNMSSAGELVAQVKDDNGTNWTATMPATAFDVDNNQWHHIAMVVDRTQEKLSIYVDGIERASATKPSGYNALAGSSDANNRNRFFVELNPTQVMDDVRVSSTAHSSQQILNTYQGTEGNLGINVFNNSPIYLLTSLTNNLTFNGYNLAGVTASANDANGNPLQVQIISNSATFVNLRIAVPNNAILGDSQIIFNSSSGTKSIPFRIIDIAQSMSAVEPDTLLLWHLDETVNGAIQVQDAGSLGLHGSASNASIAAGGRFAGGRTSSAIGHNVNTANPVNTFGFGAGSFTMETWMKTGQLATNRSIFYLRNFGGYGGGFPASLNMSSAGELVAQVKDDNGTNWIATMPATAYDVDNNQWHHIAMVVDRTQEKLSIYVDGIERASATKPSGYNALAGSSDANNRNRFFVELNPTQVMDETRVLNVARTAQEISDTWLGTTNGFASLVPKSLNPAIGKESPPKSPPNKKTEKAVMNSIVPADARIKRDSLKEELR